MKGSLVALDRWNGAKAAALVVDGRLEDLLTDPPPGGPPVPGTILHAIVDRPLKGQGAAIVQLPGGESGFLRQPGGLKPGQPVLVQVGSYAEPGKAVPVTSKLLLKGRYVILTPGAPGLNLSRKIRNEATRGELLALFDGIALGSCGAILRSNATLRAKDAIQAELRGQLDLWTETVDAASGAGPMRLLDGPDAHAVAQREWGDPDLLEDAPGAFARLGIDDMIDAFRTARVALAGGADAWIEPTRALVAIDVNSGADTSPAAGLKANIALARALPRQLRCRGLGGQITIDFAPTAKRDRGQIEQALRQALRRDTVETALVGWTPLGHYELQRKRERRPNF